MSRSCQYIGLKPEAKDWLYENAKVGKYEHTCPHCKKAIVEDTLMMPIEPYKVEEYLFTEVEFYEWKLADGRVAREVEQCSPWSSGPVVFVCLEIGNKRMFEWTNEEINYYI